MQSPLERAIRGRLADYLERRVSIVEFKDWLIGATWEVPRGTERGAVQLANRIQLAMDEFSGGFVTEDELAEDLGKVLSVVRIDAWVAESVTVTGTASTTITQAPRSSLPFAFGEPLVSASE